MLITGRDGWVASVTKRRLLPNKDAPFTCTNWRCVGVLKCFLSNIRLLCTWVSTVGMMLHWVYSCWLSSHWRLHIYYIILLNWFGIPVGAGARAIYGRLGSSLRVLWTPACIGTLYLCSGWSTALSWGRMGLSEEHQDTIQKYFGRRPSGMYCKLSRNTHVHRNRNDSALRRPAFRPPRPIAHFATTATPSTFKVCTL